MVEKGNDHGSFLKGVLTGAILRALVGVLFAPKSGKELRAELKKKGGEAFEEAKEFYSDARGKAKAICLPTTRDEDWRFTNVAPIAKLPFKPAFDPTDGVAADQLGQFAFARLAGVKLVFVNGHFSPRLSTVNRPEPGPRRRQSGVSADGE